MVNIQQVIVWRSDLKDVPLGKKMAQAGHAAHLFLNQKCHNDSIMLDSVELAWLTGEYKKIVLVARSESELLLLYEKAKELGLRANLVIDNAHTVFNQPTTTCLAIGPDEKDKIDEVTGEKGPLGKLRLA